MATPTPVLGLGSSSEYFYSRTIRRLKDAAGFGGTMLDSPTIDDPRTGGTMQDLLEAFLTLQGANLRLTSRLVAHHGVSETHLRALLVLDRTGDITSGGLGRFIGQPASSTTFLVDKLDEAGHVRRLAHPSDRRSVILTLTDSGRAVVDDTWLRYRDVFDRVIDSDDRDSLARAFRALATSLSKELDS